MAEQNNVEAKAKKYADNALLQLAARVSMLLMLPLGAFIGANVWNKVDKTNETAIRVEETLRNVVMYQIPDIRSSTQKTFEEHSHRIGKLEDWRNSVPATPTVGRP